jgi:type VI secretion system secreted protein Hcp
MSTNMYIRFENPAINGGAAGEHRGEIEVLSWSHGFVQPTTPTRPFAGGGGVEQANHQNLSFTKYLDTSTNELLKFCWSGKQIGKATISCFRSASADDAKPVRYLEIIMEHVVISNYNVSGGPGDVPVENVSLDYGTVQYTYLDRKHTEAGDEGSNLPSGHDPEKERGQLS